MVFSIQIQVSSRRSLKSLSRSEKRLEYDGHEKARTGRAFLSSVVWGQLLSFSFLCDHHLGMKDPMKDAVGIAKKAMTSATGLSVRAQ